MVKHVQRVAEKINAFKNASTVLIVVLNLN